MPCYDGMPKQETVYVEKEGSVPVEQWNLLVDQDNYKEAILCALYNELARRGILYEVVDCAEVGGAVDVRSHLKGHTQKDRVRLQKVLDEFSNDEIELLKELLKDG